MEHRFSELTEKEVAWVARQIQAASKFVQAFSPTDAGNRLTPVALDRAFAAWLGTQEQDSKAINETINCVGVAFGQFLVDGLGLAWVIATDEHGSDLAVYGLPGKGDVLIYPANFVAKRWERRETNFLEKSHIQIARDVQAISQANDTKDTRPWWKFW
jgi:hypothetical protein